MVIPINLESVVEAGISLDEYLICYCVANKRVDLLKTYIANSKSNLGIENVNKLVNMGYLFKTRDIPIFDDLYTTENTQKLLNINGGDNIFNELLEVYPKKTPSGRRLHVALEKSKQKYLKIVKGNMDLHKFIIQCVKYDIKDRINSGQADYIPMISTYINNEMWNDVMEDVAFGNTIEEPGINDI